MFRMSLENEWVKQEYLESEEETKHRPVEVEYAFYKAVKTGDIEYVQKNLDDHEFTNPEGVGQLSSDPIQSLKYLPSLPGTVWIPAWIRSRHIV